MKGKVIAENLFRFGCIAGAIVALVILLPNSKLVRADKVQVKIPIEKDVTFQMGQEEPKIVDLSEFSFGIPDLGDQATITVKLPRNPKIIQPVVVINIYHCVVDVYLDGEPIYSYGRELWEKKKVIGHEYLRIPLPEKYGGKTLQMKLLFTEEDSISSLSGFHLANAEESVIAILTDHYLELMTSMTLIVIGFIGLMVSLTRKSFDKDTRTLTWICLFAIVVALWMLCYSNIITLFVRNPSTCNVLEYFSVYIPGIPSSLFFFNIQKEKKPGYLLTFDLNGLKIANDTYGHAKGDELLKNFATILKKIFVGSFPVGRMGGDEFLVICEGMDEKLVMEKLDRIQSEIALWNREQPNEKLSAAYGYAKYDGTKEIHKVYEIADARMYGCKKKMKESLNRS